jgi:hypothetical protein
VDVLIEEDDASEDDALLNVMTDYGLVKTGKELAVSDASDRAAAII